MRIDKDCWLKIIPIAHRGLWGGKIIENSLPAFENAIEHGFAIEIDLYSSTDGQIFCFHDENLFRMTGFDGLIFNQTSEQIKSLFLNNSTHKIPTFEQVLSLVDKKVPLLIELKNQPNKDYIEKVVSLLKDYKGEFAIQSFNPFYINKVKKLAPEFLRGILASEMKTIHKSKFFRFILKNMPFNFLIKPDFISYSYSGLPLNKRKIKNRALLCWTVTDFSTFKRISPLCDNVIFENFIPE